MQQFIWVLDYLFLKCSHEFREGLGCQTKAVAEYRALILGLKQAIKKGSKHIIVKGDSELVINQVSFFFFFFFSVLARLSLVY